MTSINFNSTYRTNANSTRNTYPTNNTKSLFGTSTNALNSSLINALVLQLLSQLLQQFINASATGQTTNTNTNTNNNNNPSATPPTPNTGNQTVAEIRGTIDPSGATGTTGEPGYLSLPVSTEQKNVVEHLFDNMHYDHLQGYILDVDRNGVISAGDQVRTRDQIRSMSQVERAPWKHSLTAEEASAIKGDWGKLIEVPVSQDYRNPNSYFTQVLKENHPVQMRSKEVTGFFDRDNNGQLSEGDVLLAKKSHWFSTWNTIEATDIFVTATAEDVAAIHDRNTIASNPPQQS